MSEITLPSSFKVPMLNITSLGLRREMIAVPNWPTFFVEGFQYVYLKPFCSSIVRTPGMDRMLSIEERSSVKPIMSAFVVCKKESRCPCLCTLRRLLAFHMTKVRFVCFSSV